MARGSINKVILIGNLGQAPELRYMPNGAAVSNLTLATTEVWRDKSTGEQKELTEWHRLVFYRKLAELVTEYAKKGSKIYIEGKLRTRKWQDQTGQDRYTTEIQVDEMQLLDARRDESMQEGKLGSKGTPAFSNREMESSEVGYEKQLPFNTKASVPPSFEEDDDIPF